MYMVYCEKCFKGGKIKYKKFLSYNCFEIFCLSVVNFTEKKITKKLRYQGTVTTVED